MRAPIRLATLVSLGAAAGCATGQDLEASGFGFDAGVLSNGGSAGAPKAAGGSSAEGNGGSGERGNR